ncbi:2-iminoacetate synthase [Novipirellula aureliae]|uniref:2-iminoacetate synthase n=1 Tax=Novipirellula aureliae TaxID=2527966 RepID=A0A5C6E4G2_9BACT|nr:radical SAM protein [Novipirellula aureliae]TWU43812.1 2-iminoacetate synthase [Novipirellula aureliae]
MTTTNQSGLTSLSQFTHWIEQTDHHATHRLNLIDRVNAALSEDSLATPEERISIASQLERWRYQLLNETRVNRDNSDTNESQGAKLLAEMDYCFQRLRSSDPTNVALRSPRSPHLAIRDDDVERQAVESLQCPSRRDGPTAIRNDDVERQAVESLQCPSRRDGPTVIRDDDVNSQAVESLQCPSRRDGPTAIRNDDVERQAVESLQCPSRRDGPTAIRNDDVNSQAVESLQCPSRRDGPTVIRDDDVNSQAVESLQCPSRRDGPTVIRDDDVERQAVERARTWIDRSFPLAELEASAKRLTDQRFMTCEAADNRAKRRMVLYAPIYVSSECVNHCTYCGFRYPMQINRTHLHLDQVLDQSQILRKRGFQHQLIVAGDYPSRTSTAYFCELIEALEGQGLEIGIEIAAQSTESYAAMVSAGATGVTLYQETYDESVYESVHIRGPKSSFAWRLEAPERAAEAGFSRVGLGILLGLADPAKDFLSLVRHGFYLQHRFPNLQLAFSFPRIHEAPNDFEIPHEISDDDLVRFYCVTRMLFPQSHLVLSTREAAELRARLAHLCITQMSAGSSTSPGGYTESKGDKTNETQPRCMGEQFPVTDERSVEEVTDWLEQDGFEVRWSF